MYYDKKWSELSSAEKQEIKNAHGGAGTGARSKWQQAKEKAQSHTSNQQNTQTETPVQETTKPIQYKPETDQSKINHKTIEVKGNNQGWKSTSDEGFDSSKLPPPEEVTGSKWKDENYYKKLGIETAGAAGQRRGVEARATAAQQPKSEAAQRIARNEAIVADRGSPNRVAYEKELKELKASTGYGTGGTEDIRGHLREKIEGGWKVSQPLNDYTGTSWFRQDGATGNQTAMDHLKRVAYGDTPMSFTDLRRMGDEGYVPMAEREGTVWRDYSPGGGSDKEGYFKGMYDLNLKYGYTDKSYEDWNNDRIQGNSQLANRHKNNIQSMEDAGLIDKYGNPVPQY